MATRGFVIFADWKADAMPRAIKDLRGYMRFIARYAEEACLDMPILFIFASDERQ